MLRPNAPDLKVYLHRAPIDMRSGRNRLAAIACEVMQKDPFSNTCFLYTNNWSVSSRTRSSSPFRATSRFSSGRLARRFAG
jgi:IS66 Orf2 like protein